MECRREKRTATASDENKSSSSDTPLPRSSLHVVFKSEADVKNVEIPGEDEMKERWYTQGEYFFIKKEAMNTVRRLGSTKGLQDDENITSRGLEIIDNTAVKERETRIKKAVGTVLRKQRSLTEESLDDSSTSGSPGRPLTDFEAMAEIAKEYREVSSSAELTAIKKAHLDQKEAEEYLEDVRSQLKKNARRNNGPRKTLARLFRWKKSV
mmetsp:Transcript_21363/g.34373  ORF Transcript_21363/g.34373 Transcript_21363/m.34373 type:complete len:210 (-) Transcript_21363:63-692(-)